MISLFLERTLGQAIWLFRGERHQGFSVCLKPKDKIRVLGALRPWVVFVPVKGAVRWAGRGGAGPPSSWSLLGWLGCPAPAGDQPSAR